MIPFDFEYHRPGSLMEAARLASDLEGCEFLSGGTDLLVDFKRGARKAKHVVSITGIEELHRIEEGEDSITIGACCTHGEVARSRLIREVFPDIGEAASTIGSIQVRNSGTIGGNLCIAASCADMAPPLLTRGAKVVLFSTEGQREILVEDFFTGPRETARKPSEILTRIIVPVTPRAAGESEGAAFEKFGLRDGSAISVVSVAVRLVLEGDRMVDARIALGAVAPTPMLAVSASDFIKGREWTKEVVNGTAALASRESKPIDDVRGSAEYRRHLVDVLTRRALERARGRATG